MRELICIVCPMGCALAVEDGAAGLTVSGNRCPRGQVYAQEEVCFPKRVVTATCAAVGGEPRRIPVKTSAPCPRDAIPELLADIYRATVSLPVRAGDVIIADWRGLGIDVAATRSAGVCGA